MTPSDPIEEIAVLGASVLDLYARYRALLFVLARHGVVVTERFETEVEEYMAEHADQLEHETEEWQQRYRRSYRKRTGRE